MTFGTACKALVAAGTLATLTLATAGDAMAGGRGYYRGGHGGHYRGYGCCSTGQYVALGLGAAALGGLAYLSTTRPSYAYAPSYYGYPAPAYYAPAYYPPAYNPYYSPYSYYYPPPTYYPPNYYAPPPYPAAAPAPAYPAPTTYQQQAPTAYQGPATYYQAPATYAAPTYPVQAVSSPYPAPSYDNGVMAAYQAAPIPVGSTTITNNALAPQRER